MAGEQIKNSFKVSTFYLDSPKEVRRYEALLNDPRSSIIKEVEHKIREEEKHFADGKLMSATSRERIYVVVRYQFKDLV